MALYLLVSTAGRTVFAATSVVTLLREIRQCRVEGLGRFTGDVVWKTAERNFVHSLLFHLTHAKTVLRDHVRPHIVVSVVVVVVAVAVIVVVVAVSVSAFVVVAVLPFDSHDRREADRTVLFHEMVSSRTVVAFHFVGAF